jgi:endonuclease YncB( thermonuclease family)
LLLNSNKDSAQDQGVPAKFLCKVIDVYDGDTCTALVCIGGELGKFSLRMYGYDSPEIKPSNTDPLKEEKKARAIEARDYLKTIVQDKIFFAERMGKDKYGRLLVKIFSVNELDMSISEESINDTMIKNNYGYAYFGGKKH